MMSRLVRFFQALRRHKKKTVFFSALLAGGVHYGNEKYEEQQMMRELCEEAMRYGEALRPLGEPDRHITVLLNPAAKGGKCKATFDKYCAPLLHLAGLKVAVVRTEHEGQARDLMAIMEKTSGVVVAGGDGIVAEVLTGLLRRADQSEAVRKLPLGILPLGLSNTASSAILGFSGTPKPRHLAEATMAVVRDVRRTMDVMEITPVQTEDQVDPPKPVYAASQMVWGAFRDAAARSDLYWYWPGLKKYMTYVFSSYKDLSWDCSSEVEYTHPCSGCSRCRAQQNTAAAVEGNNQKPARRWWMNYLPKIQPVQKKEDQEPRIDYSSINNPRCGEQHHLSLGRVCEVSVSTCNTPHTRNTPPYALSLRTGPEDIGALDFIKEGWRRQWRGESGCEEERIVGKLSITPTGSTKTKEGAERELSIDNEVYEVRPMILRALPAAVTIFAPPTPSHTAS